jgi:replication factor A2
MGGANGGGFMPGSQGGGDSASAKRDYNKNTLRPVTIKQLLDAHHPHADSETVTIDNSEVSQVTLVGQVRNISAQTTNVTYKLDDGTGTIDVKVWVDVGSVPGDGDDQRPKPVEMGYARVWGKLKVMNNKRHVVATIIKPISDYNEISYHLLEATYVHLYFTRGPPESLQKSNEGSGANGFQNGYSGADSGGDSKLTGLSTNARTVYTTLRKTPQTNEGLHAQDIASRTGLEVNQVLKAGDELQAVGAIYTTVDDLTWAILDVN